jgi:NAD(P)H-quinone oxidoreductase subunit 4L
LPPPLSLTVIAIIATFIIATAMEFTIPTTIPTTIPLQAYLALAAVLFCTGVWGLINSRNAVRVLMSIELMLNAVNINLMAFSNYLDGQLIRGQVFSIFVITVAAAEAAVGLAILLSLYRNRETVDMERFNLLRW